VLQILTLKYDTSIRSPIESRRAHHGRP
jgi:hypothetical protein